ncbi:MAG: hypothetical protein HOG01_06165, partial [Methylococcales bacterium]|nr:hypothetical protein [Methylococcales bacterium]MBT4600058.1 hypothetical protein [Methylococcales bacterium]
TAQRLFEGLLDEGYSGAYDSIQRFVKQWKIDNRKSPSTKQAFIKRATEITVQYVDEPKPLPNL